MESKPPQEIVSVEFCINCNSHAWCTHHHEAKYQQVFIRLKNALQTHFPEVSVVGNSRPAQLMAINMSQNKYLNKRTQKYVIFPAIGSFEVKFCGETLFSKKAVNHWPVFQKIINQVSLRLRGVPYQPHSKEPQANEPLLDQTDQSWKPLQVIPKRDNQSPFTLTDHFKQYRHTPQAITSSLNYIGRKEIDLSEEGKKNSNHQEMIIKLDSIAQESGNLEELKKKIWDHSKSRSKIQCFDKELQHLENKFKKIEDKMDTIGKRFSNGMQLNDMQLNGMRLNDMQFSTCGSHNQTQNPIVPLILKANKLQLLTTADSMNKFLKISRLEPNSVEKSQNSSQNKVDEYYLSTQEEKNAELRKIYGEWSGYIGMKHLLKLKFSPKSKSNQSRIKVLPQRHFREIENTRVAFKNNLKEEKSKRERQSIKEESDSLSEESYSKQNDKFRELYPKDSSGLKKVVRYAYSKCNHYLKGKRERQDSPNQITSQLSKQASPSKMNQKPSKLQNLRVTKEKEPKEDSDQQTIKRQDSKLNRKIDLLPNSKSKTQSNFKVCRAQKPIKMDTKQRYDGRSDCKSHQNESKTKRVSKSPKREEQAMKTRPAQQEKKSAAIQVEQLKKQSPKQKILLSGTKKQVKQKKNFESESRASHIKRKEEKSSSFITNIDLYHVVEQSKQSRISPRGTIEGVQRASKLKGQRKSLKGNIDQPNGNTGKNNPSKPQPEPIKSKAHSNIERAAEQRPLALERKVSLINPGKLHQKLEIKLERAASLSIKTIEKPKESNVNIFDNHSVSAKQHPLSKKLSKKQKIIKSGQKIEFRANRKRQTSIEREQVIQRSNSVLNIQNPLDQSMHNQTILEGQTVCEEEGQLPLKKLTDENNIKFQNISEEQSQSGIEAKQQSKEECQLPLEITETNKQILKKASSREVCVQTTELNESATVPIKQAKLALDSQLSVQTVPLIDTVSVSKGEEATMETKMETSGVKQKKEEQIEAIYISPKHLNQLTPHQESQVIFQSKLDAKTPFHLRDRALILKRIYGANIQQQISKYEDSLRDSCRDISIEPEISRDGALYKPISKIMKNYKLFDENSIEVFNVSCSSVGSQSLRKVIDILAERNEMSIVRLFEDYKNGRRGRFGVWLCDHFIWRCVLVNQLVPVTSQGDPASLGHRNGQVWPILLEKAIAKLLGGYDCISTLTTGEIFHMLTGSNFVPFRINEDCSRNQKFLKFIGESEKKNLVVHAEKTSQGIEEEERLKTELNKYYILSKKTVNESETLLKVKENREEAVWMKLVNFCQLFNKAEVLHLRLHHFFTSLSLPPFSSTALTVLELYFEQKTFGCITISNKLRTGSLKTYLYREEGDSVLRLVGQAQERSSKKLFFDCSFSAGKYVLFVECEQPDGIVSFFGEGQPKIIIKEQIHSASLKNEMSEYLPVDALQPNDKPKMPRAMKAFMEERGEGNMAKLRSEFVEFMAKGKHDMPI